MQSKLNPYISFNGDTKQAMEFYKSVFGGELTLTTFAEAGMSENQAVPTQIMHAMLVCENDMTLMASDVPDGMPYNPGTNVSISLSGDNDEQLSGYFEGLATGGTVAQPLETAPWGDKFGMITDQFGIFWMVNIAPAK